jgi:hypothetical protein
MINPIPWIIPDATTPGGTGCGTQVWFGDAVPSGDTTVQTQFQLGDFLWITLPTAGLPLMYKCTTAPSSTNKDGIWSAIEGGLAVKSVAAAYAATANDSTIEQTNGVGVAITLPAASTANTGKTYTIKNVNGAVTNTVVVAAGGAIDGGTTVTLAAAYSAVQLRSDGTKYVIVGGFSTLTVA